MNSDQLPDITDQTLLLAVDPGREKSGVAIMIRDTAELVVKAIYPTDQLEQQLQSLGEPYKGRIKELVCGNGTNHKYVFHLLEDLAKQWAITAQLAEEAHTTEMARKRYFQYHPPRGLKRLVPKGMLYPPVPVDDFTAWIIGEQYILKMSK